MLSSNPWTWASLYLPRPLIPFNNRWLCDGVAGAEVGCGLEVPECPMQEVFSRAAVAEMSMGWEFAGHSVQGAPWQGGWSRSRH